MSKENKSSFTNWLIIFMVVINIVLSVLIIFEIFKDDDDDSLIDNKNQKELTDELTFEGHVKTYVELWHNEDNEIVITFREEMFDINIESQLINDAFENAYIISWIEDFMERKELKKYILNVDGDFEVKNGVTNEGGFSNLNSWQDDDILILYTYKHNFDSVEYRYCYDSSRNSYSAYTFGDVETELQCSFRNGEFAATTGTYWKVEDYHIFTIDYSSHDNNINIEIDDMDRCQKIRESYIDPNGGETFTTELDSYDEQYFTIYGSKDDYLNGDVSFSSRDQIYYQNYIDDIYVENYFHELDYSEFNSYYVD